LDSRIRLTLFVFGTAILLLGISGMVIYKLDSMRMQAEARAANQLQVLLQLDDFASLVKQAESAQRGYLLTGHAVYLRHFVTLTNQIQARYAGFTSLVRSGDLPADGVTEIGELTDKRLAELDDTIRIRSQQGIEAAIKALQTSEGRNIMSQIDSQFKRIRLAEKKGLNAAMLRSQQVAEVRTRAFILISLFNVAFLWWGWRKVSTRMRRQQETARDMTRLQQIGAQCARAGDQFNERLREILDAALELTNANSGSLLLLDGSGYWRVAAQCRLDEPFLQALSKLSGKSPEICGLPIESENPVFVRDVKFGKALAGSPWKDLLLSAGVQSLLGTPLSSSSGKLLGVIAVYFPEPHYPTEQRMRFMQLLARQSADYVERKNIEEQLRNAHEQLADRALHLEEIVRQRTARLQEVIGDLEALSYSIIHDMRAPLRSMQGFAHLLEEESLANNANAINYVARIKIASARMDQLIQDALVYSHLMRADVPLTRVELDAFLKGTLETYDEFQLPHARVEVATNLPSALANEGALTQCVSNLLRNAVKFVPPRVLPHIRIWSETHEDRVFLFFKDNGVGIEPRSHTKIFEIFRQLDQRREGTGIGLAIVKKAAERMNGRVGVHSEPGEGSTFWLDLMAAPTLDQQESHAELMSHSNQSTVANTPSRQNNLSMR